MKLLHYRARAVPWAWCALTLLLLAAAPARATWYAENVGDGADLIMMDLRWPWWPSGTYFANWNSSFNPKPNNLSFYAGFVSWLPDGPGQTPNPDPVLQAAFRPGSVWTFWGANPQGTPVRFTDVAPNLYIKNDYGGEGSSGTTGAEPWDFVKPGRWYTMLARVWLPGPGTNYDHAFIGRWIKNPADGQWHLIGTARLPIPAVSFTGNSGFLEPLASEKAVRSLHRRLGYYRRDGHWAKSDTIAIDKTEFVVVNVIPEEDHEYAAIEYAQRPDLIPLRLTGPPLARDRRYEFQTRQPAAPRLDAPLVTNVIAEAAAGQVAVSWEIPAGSSPSFAWRIEVFDNAACTGAPVAVREERAPAARQALLTAAAARPTVRLTVTDVFDQAAAPVVATAAASPALSPATGAAVTRPGLAYELYEQDATRRTNYFEHALIKPDEIHHWLGLAELGAGRLTRQGLARGFDLSVRGGRSSAYALVYRGRLHAPADGLYLLHAQIDGAYQIRLDEGDALGWDGQHGTTEKTSVARLAAGDHPLRVEFLYDELPAGNFTVEWEGPGFSRRSVGIADLRVMDDGSLPVPQIATRAAGDGTGRIAVTVEARGHRVDETTLFLGSLELVADKGPAALYDGPLPRGESRFRARVRFDGTRTVDSEPVDLSISGPESAPGWTVRNVGDARASAGVWADGAGGFQFFGNGMHTVTRSVTGDFTLTCKLGDHGGARGEPVNPMAWAGVAAFEHGERLNWEWGRDFYLVQTAAEGLRTSADNTDFGATRISSYPLPADRPWLRIVREGQVWTAWTATNGGQWELGGWQYKRAERRMDAGLFFSALPQDARAHYHARVSGLAIEPGVAPGCALPVPSMARNTGGDRLTGVVMAPSDPAVVVVRSSFRGLLRSVDHGKTWSEANGALTGDDLAVRSVVIHPLDPRVMLRAGGQGAGSGLWKTQDGGGSWRRLDLAGDFDGRGPSALCGEVIAFDLRDPDRVFAGCETKGCFVSTNSGASWSSLGLAGERVTAVRVWPWEKHYPAPAQGRTHLCVVTCPDRWMGCLGRGEPAATPAATSRAYLTPDGGRTLSLADERADTGFYNVVFDKALQSTTEMRLGTSHGLQAEVFSGAQMALYPAAKHVEWLRPMTALGAAARGDEKFGLCLAQALDPLQPGRLSRSAQWAFEWEWLPLQGDVPRGGWIAACGDVALGREWWFVTTDGLYHSTDGGGTMTRVMGATLSAGPRR